MPTEWGAAVRVRPRRVLVLGGPGGGTTDVATMVATSRGLLPYHDLDRLAYEPPAQRTNAPAREWTRVSDETRRERAVALASGARWLAGGQYAGWTEPLRDAAQATAQQLRERDEANGTRTLEAFLSPVSNKVIHCRSLRDIAETIERLNGRSWTPS